MIDDLARRIGALPKPLLLGLDVDGTLAPIVDEPMAARVPGDVLAALARLADRADLRVALLTGRDAAALATVAPIEGLWRAVEHGRVRIAPDGRAHAPPLSSSLVEALETLEEELAPLVREGARLERKPAARAIHVRGMEGAEGQRLLERAAAAGEALGLHARRGRAVVELEASPGDKGDALRALAELVGAASAVFAGDDLTDAPALEAARALGGVAIFVASPERETAPTEVDAVLNGPGEVAQLLACL